MQRIVLLIVAVCLFPSMALARTWTNREGKEIVADFVDATEEKVTLKMSSGKVVTFGLEKLSDEDQNFIRGILARRVGKKPSASSEEPGSPFETVESPARPATDLKSIVEPKSTEKVEGLGTMRDVDETNKKTKPENREWTDAFGNKTSGKFIRLQGNNVVVLRGGRPVTLDYWQLSETDKDYLKELGESNGWAHLIPKVNPAEQRNKAPGANLAGNPGFNSGPAPGAFSGPTPGVSSPGPAAGVSSPGPAPGLSSSPPPGTSNPEDLAKRLRELEEKNRSTATYSPPPSATTGNSTFPSSGGTSYTPPPSASASYGGPSSGPMTPPPGMSSAPPGSSFTSPGVGPPPGASMAGPTMPGSSMPSSSMPSSSMPSSSMPSSTFPSMNEPNFGGPTMVMEKLCGSCGKTVPSNITAGGSCPHCGVYFSFDDTNGKKANPGMFGGGGGGGPSRGAIRGIIVLVVLGIKGFAYMVWRSQQSS